MVFLTRCGHRPRPRPAADSGSTADFTGPVDSTDPSVADDECRPSSRRARSPTSPATPSGWRRYWPQRRPVGRLRPANPCLSRCGRLEPIMLESDQICDGIGYPVSFDYGPRLSRDYGPGLPERVVREPIPDESSATALRLRRSWSRQCSRTTSGLGQHDLPVHALLGLAGRRLQRVPVHVLQVPHRRAHRRCRGWFAEAHDDTASIALDGWEIQRRCPHLKADLSKFGVVEGNTLTCNRTAGSGTWRWPLPDHEGPRAEVERSDAT